MKDLNYDHSLYYSLKEKHKSLEIKDFKTKNILGIQFITDHNYKKNQFTIEILYHYQQEILELSFYKEISNESKYISKISIPKIFPMILESNYIQKDHDLSIQSTPHFINERTVNQLLKKSYHLPIIILYKNKKCLVNPFILNQELYGMCHIIVIPTNKEINYVQINYPNNEKEKLFYEKKFIQTMKKKNSFMKKNLFKHSFNIFVIICYKKMNFILFQNFNNLNKNRSAISFL